MRSSQTVISLVIVTLFAFNITSLNAKSIEKMDENPNYFVDIVNRLDKLKEIPLIGDFISSYISTANKMIVEINKATDGNVANLINNMMPCYLDEATIKCNGTLNFQSLRIIGEKALRLLPTSMLPPAIVPLIQMISNIL